jgi:transcription elongation factor/antiterminator RfaH
MLNWYLIYTKPKNEDIVSHKFIQVGFKVLNSKIKERKYYRRRLQDVTSPLFPCYIFVKFDYPKDYRLIKYTRGVKRIVGTDSTPTIVPQHIINSINRRMEQGIITIGPPDFKSGEEVVIKGGPFQGFDAVFERKLKGSERVSILLKAINARVVVDGALLLRTDSIR